MLRYWLALTVILSASVLASTQARAASSDRLTAATEAYLFLYPLVTMEMSRRVTALSPPTPDAAPTGMNRFRHMRELPSGSLRSVVRPNFDTLYSLAWIDLRQGPVVMTVPAIDDRFFLLPFMDMYTDVIAVAGTGTVSESGEEIVVLPPGWEGELPDDLATVTATTDLLWVIGRIQTNGEEDYEYINGLQDQLALRQLSGQPYVQEQLDGEIDRSVSTKEMVEGLDGSTYFRLGLDLLEKNGAHTTDWTLMQRMRLASLDSADALATVDRDLLDQARTRALALLDEMGHSVSGAAARSGWGMQISGIGVYGNNYANRAYIARVGLGANPPEWAVYPLAARDALGNVPDSSNAYTLHFPPGALPPNHGFWSITVYDEFGFPTANPLDRYALGDRSDLNVNEDGSVTLYLQHDRPDESRIANWLPTPDSGVLGVTMRIYGPDEAILTGRWTPPMLTPQSR